MGGDGHGCLDLGLGEDLGSQSGPLEGRWSLGRGQRLLGWYKGTWIPGQEPRGAVLG